VTLSDLDVVGVALNVGDTFSVTVTPDSGTSSATLYRRKVPVASGMMPGILSYTFAKSESVSMAVALATGTGTFDYACTPAGVPTPDPLPWVQAYGIFHQDDTCAVGWNPSWQEWAMAITGGWVCTRTIPSLG
jgi:hypothetical protein